MDPPLLEAVDSLGGWAGRRHASPVEVTLLGHLPLVGGFVADAVTRLDFELSAADGTRERLSVVLKRVDRPEMRAMRALQDVPGHPAELPELLGEGRDERGFWVLMPFFAGRAPKGPIPHSVFRALAELHVAFAGPEVERLALPPIDADSWRHLCLHVAHQVDEVLGERRLPLLERVRDSLLRRAGDARLGEALRVLPRTLVHGDMHPGNVVVTPEGAAIIDWGNARSGPEMLDLANVTEMGSPPFHAYLKRCVELTAMPPDLRLVRIGFLWATVYVNTAYMGFAVTRDFLGIDGVGSLRPAYVENMVDRAESALEALGREL
jgi:serine/threonine protein kinase